MDAVGSHMNCNRVAGDRKRKDSHQGRAGTPDWESMPASQACARKSQGLFSKPQTLPPAAKSSDFAPKPKVSPVLELRGIRCDGNTVYLSADGRDVVELGHGETVRIRRSSAVTRLLRVKRDGFLGVLNRKMWAQK